MTNPQPLGPGPAGQPPRPARQGASAPAVPPLPGHNVQPPSYPYGPPPNYPPGPPLGYPYPPQPPRPNWFIRHKILTGVLALLCIGVLANAGEDHDRQKSATPRTVSASTTPAPTETASAVASEKSALVTSSASASSSPVSQTATAKSPGIGVPLRDGDVEFTVTKVERHVTTAGSGFMAERAQGEYTLVHLTARNIGSSSQSLSDNDQVAYTADGTQYSVDGSAGIALDNNDLGWGADINPGNQVTGVLAFDTPPGVKLTELELHDGFLSDGVTVSLP